MRCASTWRVDPWRRLLALTDRERLRFSSAAAQSILLLLDASSAWSTKPDWFSVLVRLVLETDSFEPPPWRSRQGRAGCTGSSIAFRPPLRGLCPPIAKLLFANTNHPKLDIRSHRRRYGLSSFRSLWIRMFTMLRNPFFRPHMPDAPTRSSINI